MYKRNIIAIIGIVVSMGISQTTIANENMLFEPIDSKSLDNEQLSLLTTVISNNFLLESTIVKIIDKSLLLNNDTINFNIFNEINKSPRNIGGFLL